MRYTILAELNRAQNFALQTIFEEEFTPYIFNHDPFFTGYLSVKGWTQGRIAKLFADDDLFKTADVLQDTRAYGTVRIFRNVTLLYV